MADNTQLNPGAGGDIIATDEVIADLHNQEEEEAITLLLAL